MFTLREFAYGCDKPDLLGWSNSRLWLSLHEKACHVMDSAAFAWGRLRFAQQASLPAVAAAVQLHPFNHVRAEGRLREATTWEVAVTSASLFGLFSSRTLVQFLWQVIWSSCFSSICLSVLVLCRYGIVVRTWSRKSETFARKMCHVLPRHTAQCIGGMAAMEFVVRASAPNAGTISFASSPSCHVSFLWASRSVRLRTLVLCRSSSGRPQVFQGPLRTEHATGR